MPVLHGHAVRSPWPLVAARVGTPSFSPVDVVVDPQLDEQALRELEGRADGTTAEGGAWSIGWDAEQAIASFAGAGTYAIRRGTLEVRTAQRGPDHRGWERHLLTWAVPMLLASRGHVVLHAATCPTAQGALLLCGPSGRGKSTTSLALAERTGLGVLTDDVSVLARERPDRPHKAWAGMLGSRVVAGARGKRVVHADAPGETGADVRGIVLLGPRDGSQARRLDPATALVRTMGHLLIAGPHQRGPALASLAALLEEVPAYAVGMPSGRHRLPDALDALLDAT